VDQALAQLQVTTEEVLEEMPILSRMDLVGAVAQQIFV
jgi:hypothetical protein